MSILFFIFGIPLIVAGLYLLFYLKTILFGVIVFMIAILAWLFDGSDHHH